MRITVSQLKALVREAMEAHDELETSRLVIKTRILDNKRLFADAFIKEPDWLDQAVGVDQPVFEITIDLNSPTQGTVYLNYGSARRQGKGYGPEVISALLDMLAQRGFARARGYIERDNFSSQRMVKKLGFEPVEEKAQGSYWEREI
jgi:RimJ/RimL family protein N-acetyltransferase